MSKNDATVSESIALRVSADLKAELEQLAALEGLHVSTFVRRAALLDVRRRRQELAANAA